MSQSYSGFLRAAEARRYIGINPTDLPPVDKTTMIEGPGNGIYYPAGAAPRRFQRYGAEFLDDPDAVGLFTPANVGPAVYHSPPDFAVGVNDSLLVGYRSILMTDGRFFSDHVSLTKEAVQSRLERLARPEEFANEATGLRPSGDEGHFRLALNDRPVRRLEGRVVVLCSDEMLSYGSFLFRILPKIRTIRDLGLMDMRCLAYAHPKNCRLLLNMAGIPDDNIIQHDFHGVTQIERAIVPGLRCPDTYFDPETCDLFAELRASYGSPERNRRLYVSRYGLNRAGWSTRIMRNEEELIARLGSIGFEAIEPEQMSMREQIAAFASASIVVGPSGSGMFNTIFCHPGTKIIDLQSESQWIYSYTGMYASLGLRYGIFVGKAETPDGQPVHRPWQVNIEALMVRLRTFLAN